MDSQPFRLLRPLYLMTLSLCFLPLTAVSLVASLQLSTLLDPSRFQRAWFARFWAYFGPLSRKTMTPVVTPLLRAAHGVVLDVGPGSGNWVHLYNPERSPRITKIYGVEPNHGHHAALRQAIKSEGLEGIYEVIGAGAEDLARYGIAPGSVDTIITVQVLCSVPNPQSVIRDLYAYLKPGGVWLMCEHVRTGFELEFVHLWQRWIDFFWPLCFDGCSITRPTDRYLLHAGPWAAIDVRVVDDEGRFDVIPHSIGTLTK